MLSRKEFLTLVLPPLGEGEHYCSWGINAQERIRQVFVQSIDDLLQLSDGLLADSYNSFFGMSTFGIKENGRYATNSVSLKSFFLDIDCGPSKPYADIEEGIRALRAFCKATGLPRPTLVQSGRGVHAYWILEDAISRDEWKPHAERLKELCAEHKFETDPAVPADAARVMRMPGTKHLKDLNNPLPVELIYTAPAIPNKTILDILAPTEAILDAIAKSNFKRPMDAVTLALIGSSQSNFKTIMLKTVKGEGCAQLLHAYDNQATLDEPLWRAALSIAQHCVDRDKAIHRMSDQHPEYNAQVTEKKASETKGPYTCETFKKLNPSACEGCTHKITSPIQLGKEIVEATEEDNTVTDVESTTKEVKTYVIPSYPFPFFRGKAGGIYVHTKNKDDEDKDEIVYPYDFYVVKRMTDPDIGETLLMRLHLPKDGVREFIMPLATALSKDKFRDMIATHGIAALNKQQDALMLYVTKWVEVLQMSMQAEKAHKQFGWTEDNSSIIVGDREVKATEVVYSPPSTPTLPLVPLFQPKGDFHIWKDVINAYGREGMEDRAFAFFMGFGSMLLKFTALDGFLLNLMSRESGSGKTTILHAINSIYGRPKELLLAPKDTYNSRMQRMGTMQSFALTMDEITNMPPEAMSQMVYDVTSGRGKNRMMQHVNAERLNHTKWASGLITSSNRSVPDALMSIKGFPDGEMNRVMELLIKPDPQNDPIWSRNHFGRLLDNYGHAIEPYAQALVGQLPAVVEKLKQCQERVDILAETRSTERYWSLMVASSITGGTVAKALGLHDIPIKPVFNFAIQHLRDTRVRTREYMFDSDDYLGGFLQRHFHEILVINGIKDAKTGLDFGPIKEPRGALTARYEPDTKMLYVVVKTYRDECAKTMINYDESLLPYRKSKALVEIKKKRMTAGTAANTQAAVNALCFDTTKLDFFDDKVLLKDEDTERAATGAVGEV